jgi:hypothetical protein
MIREFLCYMKDNIIVNMMRHVCGKENIRAIEEDNCQWQTTSGRGKMHEIC